MADGHEFAKQAAPLAGGRADGEEGLIAETATGGYGFWYGFRIGPMPRRG
jgi:hypothetical protein